MDKQDEVRPHGVPRRETQVRKEVHPAAASSSYSYAPSSPHSPTTPFPGPPDHVTFPPHVRTSSSSKAPHQGQSALTDKFWSCIRLQPCALSHVPSLHKLSAKEEDNEDLLSSNERTGATFSVTGVRCGKEVGRGGVVMGKQWSPTARPRTRRAGGCSGSGSSGGGGSGSSGSGGSVCSGTTNKPHHSGRNFGSPSWHKILSSPTPTQLYFLLAVASVSVYVNGLTGEYVHDDLSAVLRNPDVQGTRPLWQLFLNDFWGKPMKDPASHKSYRPLTILSFRLCHMLWGNSSTADHSVNLVLHAAVTLLYAHTLLHALQLRPAQVLLSGLTFATHPVHTEAVTGVVGRADLLAAAAFLASFCAYHRSVVAAGSGREGAWLRWAAVWACMGVGCKEHALTVLGVCVAWDLAMHASALRRCVLGRWDSCLLTCLARRLGKVIGLSVVVVSVRVGMMRAAPVFSDQDNPASFSRSPLTRFLTKTYLPAHNTWLLLCPVQLSYDWQLGSIPLVTSLSDPRNAASCALYGALVLLLFSSFRSRQSQEGRASLWALLVLVIPFLPASNLLFPVGFMVAERVLYIPSLGWCTLVGIGAARVGVGVSRVSGKLGRGRAATHLLLALLLAFSFRTLRRNLDWRSREELFTSGLRTLPHNAKMHYNYANLLRDQHRPEMAIVHYREAIRLWWVYPSAHNNLGTLLLQRHPEGTQWEDEAEWHFTVALQTHPGHQHAGRNLAALWRQQGRVNPAVSLLESHFVPEDEESGDTGRLLADLLLQEGRHKEAEDVFLRLTAAQPSNPAVLADYAAFLHKLGRTEAAARHFEAALSLDPAHTHALTSYAALVTAHDHHADAHHLYTRLHRALARHWDPDTAMALARLCILMGKLGEADSVLSRITQHHPTHLTARVHMAQVRLQQRHYGESESLLEGVLREAPLHQEALYHLSLLYSSTNRSGEALEAATAAAKACREPRDLCALLHAHHADLLHTLTFLEDAVTSYQLAVRMEPALSRAHLNLGAIYHTQGRYQLAWKHYQSALTRDPHNSLLLENIEKLRRVMNPEARGR
ncbi:protein O-mannosyl-transferase TMTC1-like isoform X1 [Scylla paramamosain]|uniref:protein O-mannosyl-transferase TMTC1-like isoform X1 n=1 Tax=Scylla paramamosain TaxID=85552 RepID=UPI0030836A71